MKTKNRRKRIFANKLHREIFLLITFASILPAAIFAVFLYYLIFNITADQIGIPEAIAYNLLPSAKRVLGILFFAAPFSVFLILTFAYGVAHKIIGPFDRIVKELGEHVDGKRKGHIRIRKADKFQPLVYNINKLIDK